MHADAHGCREAVGIFGAISRTGRKMAASRDDFDDYWYRGAD